MPTTDAMRPAGRRPHVAELQRLDGQILRAARSAAALGEHARRQHEGDEHTLGQSDQRLTVRKHVGALRQLRRR